jgi:outer membrane protein OmpA-like peptidoglycan-associated protein
MAGLDAQNIYHPWQISAGAGFADFHAINKPFTEQLQNANWMGEKAPTSLRIGRLVKPWLTVSASYSMISLETDKLNNIPLNKAIDDDKMMKATLQAEYKFANGKLLQDEFFIDPYVFTGFSASILDEETYPGIPAGFGINIWPLDYLGINFQASYEYVFDFNDYMNYTLGITARFGNMIDKDLDRIADRYDACPEIWGLESMDGCPDYDHDGVTDSLDKCPKEYGWPPAGGCPDFDKDGIPDKEDACPCEAGSKKFDGCPDAIQKSTEQQPDAKPDSKAESIAPEPKQQTRSTQLQEPIEQTEPIKAIVPVPAPEPATIDEAIDPHLDNIHFEANSAAIKPSSYPSLDKILDIMRKNPMQQFTIQGYTDNSGPDEYNLFLSEVRAKSIREYFTKKGIDASRLEAKGFGEIDEKNLNLTEEARAKNRRVEIYLKK